MPFGTIEKAVGETPLVALERFRELRHISKETPLAYAGRLDPMASGKLLILIGDECKVQEKYHSFDKEYKVEILLGASSDTGDVLGLLTSCDAHIFNESEINAVLGSFVGEIQLPYPHFSSRTVQGKPLHTWTLENKLNEIEIPVKKSRIHKITFDGFQLATKTEILKTVRTKIETIPPVTDARKALGADFRRDSVRASWNGFEETAQEKYQIISFTCIASSGTYMRSLGEHMAKKLGTCGLAYSIHRTKVGKYIPITKSLGVWVTQF
jgi:tRNA pseudouridine(55) synthase